MERTDSFLLKDLARKYLSKLVLNCKVVRDCENRNGVNQKKTWKSQLAARNLPINSAQSPNLLTLELKVDPHKHTKGEKYVTKESVEGSKSRNVIFTAHPLRYILRYRNLQRIHQLVSNCLFRALHSQFLRIENFQ